MNILKGFNLCFAIYELIYGIILIIKGERIHPLTFMLLAVIVLLDAIGDILEDYMK